MKEGLFKSIIELSNNILKEIKVSYFLYEYMSNIKRLEATIYQIVCLKDISIL